jgi:hypothetical protein
MTTFAILTFLLYPKEVSHEHINFSMSSPDSSVTKPTIDPRISSQRHPRSRHHLQAAPNVELIQPRPSAKLSQPKTTFRNARKLLLLSWIAPCPARGRFLIDSADTPDPLVVRHLSSSAPSFLTLSAPPAWATNLSATDMK